MSASQATVGIIDYGAGNIRSIVNSLNHLGSNVVVVSDISSLKKVSHIILPGVGAFGHCSKKLIQSGLLDYITECVLVDRKPTLGICVGMQLMADNSDELGFHIGLGWLGGEVRKIVPTDQEIRIPHVGWNDVTFSQEFGDFRNGESFDFYFDHSYALKYSERGDTIAICRHGEKFCAVVRRNNIVASQFHPEKSQNAGLRFMRGFLAM
jgi:glutamine amidotransferase